MVEAAGVEFASTINSKYAGIVGFTHYISWLSAISVYCNKLKK
jgi:hypothetical protein